MYARAASVYRRVDLDSAPKHQILDQLFARLLTDVDTARKAIAARDIKAKAMSIDHAIEIVGELRSALDHAAAPEVCANLASLYEYVLDRLSRASSRLDGGLLDHVTTVVTQLRQAFADAVIVAAGGTVAAPALPAAPAVSPKGLAAKAAARAAGRGSSEAPTPRAAVARK